MAPIFGMGKSRNTQPNKEAFEESVDPVMDAVRRQFLLSGVPQELRKQKSDSSTVPPDASEHAPFPDVCHVQQTDSENVWDLKEANLVLADLSDCICSQDKFPFGSFSGLASDALSLGTKKPSYTHPISNVS